MREKPISWLPIDSRLLPFDLRLKAPHSPLVKGLIALELLLAVVVVVGSLALVFWPKQNLLPLLPNNRLCQENTGCVLGIRIDQCCDCPQAYLREIVEEDPGLVFYEPMRDYRQLRPKNCQEVYCSACSFYNTALCTSNGACQGMVDSQTLR